MTAATVATAMISDRNVQSSLLLDFEELSTVPSFLGVVWGTVTEANASVYESYDDGGVSSTPEKIYTVKPREKWRAAAFLGYTARKLAG